jgi:hypothetical protein
MGKGVGACTCLIFNAFHVARIEPPERIDHSAVVAIEKDRNRKESEKGQDVAQHFTN